MNPESKRTLARWRLVLGKYASPKMPIVLTGDEEKMADALELLYSREYKGRGLSLIHI